MTDVGTPMASVSRNGNRASTGTHLSPPSLPFVGGTMMMYVDEVVVVVVVVPLSMQYHELLLLLPVPDDVALSEVDEEGSILKSYDRY